MEIQQGNYCFWKTSNAIAPTQGCFPLCYWTYALGELNSLAVFTPV